MWRKFTERNKRRSTKIIKRPHELYRFLATPGVQVLKLAFGSEDVVWLSWIVSAEKIVTNLRHTTEVIGAYVTTGARIHLYVYLD